MLSRLVIPFLPRSKHLLILWLRSPCAVILEPKKIKSLTVSIVSPSISHEVMGPDAIILVFWMLSFKLTFSFSTFTFVKRLFSSSSLWSIGHYLLSPLFLEASVFRKSRNSQSILKIIDKKITLLHKGGVICISEVIDISPSNLDSSLCFIQPGISHDVLCIFVF